MSDRHEEPASRDDPPSPVVAGRSAGKGRAADATAEDDAESDHGETGVPEVSSPIERSIVRADEIAAMTLDPAYEPSNARLRELGIASDLHPDLRSPDLVSMATVSFAVGGGSLRTFSGGLPHHCG